MTRTLPLESEEDGVDLLFASHIIDMAPKFGIDADVA